MPELSVSTWSLHRTLGATYPTLEVHPGDRAAALPYGAGTLSLLQTPAYVAQMGLRNLEICHFHFPCTDPSYLAELRRALSDAGVRLMTLLIDAGDIAASDAAARERDLRRIKDWIDVAAQLGAARVRVSAGTTPPDAAGQALGASIAAFGVLAEYAHAKGIGIITENWQALAARPPQLLSILDALDGAVGLCADFGNFDRATRYDDLRAVLPRADSIHAKADWDDGTVDAASFQRCLDLAREAGFQGTYVMIFDDPGDERAQIMHLAELTRPYLN